MRRCAPWSSTGPAARCGSRPTSTTPSPARARRSRRPRVRGLPHRPAHRRRRARGPAPAARPRPPDRRHRPRGGRRGGRRARRAGRRPVARLDVRRVPVLPQRPREPLRPRALHRPRRRRRLRRRGPSPTRASASRCPRATTTSQAAPLLCAGLIGYRALRMTGDAERLGPLRLRRRRAHRLPGRASTRAGACSPSPAPATRAAQAFARSARREWAGDAIGPRARGARRGDHLRPRRRAGPGGAAGAAPGGVVVCARDPHERHPVVPLRGPVGRAVVRSVANLTRADGASCSTSPRACPCAPT